MTTAVKNTAVEFPYAIGDVAASSKEKAVSQDFMKILTQERDKAQQAGAMQDKADSKSRADDVQESEYDNDVQDEYDKAETNSVEEEEAVTEEREAAEASAAQETAEEQTEEGPSEEELEAVEEALRKILEEMQARLQMSEEEILGAAEDLGLSVVDLLNPENMAQLVLTLEGQDSPIHLVTDEMMYQNVQELTAFVEEQAAQFMEETGLTPEELDSLMEQLKQLEEAATMTDDTAEVMNAMEDGDELNITVKGEQTKPQDASAQVTQAAKEVQTPRDEHSANEETTKEGEKHFQNQQANAVEYKEGVSNAPTATTVADFMKEGSMDVESLLRQLTDQVKIQHGQEITEMELQLHPASLGTVNVTLATKGGVVTAELTTQNEAVRNAIEAQVVQLKANLEEQGVKVEAIEVSVASHELEKNLDQSNQEQGEPKDSQKAESIQGSRRRSINLNALEEGEGLGEGEAVEDEATRLAVEMMAMHGNSMDLMA